ncbi:hypothetical protein SAMN04488061_0546 [Filomicrobium insigne]|uniref:Uncharacterized protein n=1 Tax=Filomicrobium insigne TaxID=418854 RepID=A0A1H0HLJ7_9HYPH|nr:hypothetical protein SAMN04488061_0546 [Filomicrobium insigne]
MRKKKQQQTTTLAPGEKVRHCLVCHEEFVSAWSGNRVCNRCRSTAVWKQGA